MELWFTRVRVKVGVKVRVRVRVRIGAGVRVIRSYGCSEGQDYGWGLKTIAVLSSSSSERSPYCVHTVLVKDF